MQSRLRGEHFIHGVFGEAFLDSTIEETLKPLVYGKRVLDVGCGMGDWCYTTAQSGSKSVDGFDIQEDMVKLAKQATSDLDTVHIQVGDAANMPYNDASFDVALSFFVSCNLAPEAFKKHFQELYRVLESGGKAIIAIPTDWSHSRLYTKFESDPAIVESKISRAVTKIPKYPTTTQITEALKGIDEIIYCCFSVDPEGNVFRVKSIDQLTYGQQIWKYYTDVMLFTDYFYSDRSSITEILSAGFHIDSIENYFTEEKRVAYNSKKPNLPLIKKFVKEPPALVYYVSKPGHIEPPY